MDVDTPKDEQQIARNIEALKSRLRGRGRRRGGRGGRQVTMEGWGGRDSQSNSECAQFIYAFLRTDPVIAPRR